MTESEPETVDDDEERYAEEGEAEEPEVEPPDLDDEATIERLQQLEDDDRG